tara:strand:- start:3724 stop:4458 length:735 start_codon:yes stop_codon:yes gene_type:complete
MNILDHIDILAIFPSLFLIPCLLYHFLKIEKINVDPSKLAYGATAMGMLLTFFGIWKGLIGFDVTATEESIPILLGGLKIAFSSSIVGLSTSLVINLFFVSAVEQNEQSLENIEDLLVDLNKNINSFTLNLAEANIDALRDAIEDMIKSLEMGINSETKESINKFKESIEMLREWQERYIEEITVVTDSMDKNAIVTKATSSQLVKINETLADLKPITETIAESINWVQQALPAFRKKGNITDK